MDLPSALAFSRYAERTLAAQPALRDELIATLERPFDWGPAENAIEAAAADSPDALAVALRRLRARVFLHTAPAGLARVSADPHVEDPLAAALGADRPTWRSEPRDRG